MDWIDLAQDRDHCRSLVNTVMNLWIPWNAGKFWGAAQLTASQEGLISMKLVSLKVMSSPCCLTKNHVMKTHGRSGALTPHILIINTRLDQWSASLPGRFISLDTKLGRPHNLARRGGCWEANFGCSPHNPVTI
jgi:hypothetical protein